jgi:hypothetical protein
MGSPVVHFEIRSADPDASRAFYGKLFGWTFPDGGIGPLQGGDPLVTFFVGVQDVAATLQAAAEAGGKVVQPATDVPGVRFGLFADPFGQVVGIAAPTG